MADSQGKSLDSGQLTKMMPRFRPMTLKDKELMIYRVSVLLEEAWKARQKEVKPK